MKTLLQAFFEHINNTPDEVIRKNLDKIKSYNTGPKINDILKPDCLIEVRASLQENIYVQGQDLYSDLFCFNNY